MGSISPVSVGVYSHLMACPPPRWLGPWPASAAPSPPLTSCTCCPPSLMTAEPGLSVASRALCLSLSDRLLQLQVMPLSRLHLRHFRRVQTCSVLYLSALLLYPQVSCPPAAFLPSASTHQGRERVDLHQLLNCARHLWSHQRLLVTLQMTLRGCLWEAGECLQICGVL